MAVPSKEARDRRLDELSSAVTVWATRRRKALKDQIDFSKRLLRGRGFKKTTTEKATSLLVDELDQFLTGE